MSRVDPFAHRVTELNDKPVRDGAYVLYWMQTSQRAAGNHALEWALRLANERGLPVLVGFGLTADYPDACERHYRFMLEGLRETASAIRERGIGFVLRLGDPPEVALELGREAAAIVCDRAYLAHLREWRYRVARGAGCMVVEVESELIVPVEEASSKQEYAARTIRPRIHRRLGDFLISLPAAEIRRRSNGSPLPGENTDDVDGLLRALGPAADPGPVSEFFLGGAAAARARLDRFIEHSLDDYEEKRSEPSLDVGSTLSPYLHFGQISELDLALALDANEFLSGMEAGRGEMKHQPGSVGMRTDSDRRASARDAFLEELLVRRGLAHNYVWYCRDYASYDGLPEWSRRTLLDHADDAREHEYSDDDLAAARTHDPHWNAAMREARATGFMHNYMRMYWGKKVLEWTADPREAYDRLLRLNNTWFLDGRDPNSYANVGWVFGLHDRPWTERAVFGKVRYMNANGLLRKFDMDAYEAKVRRLELRSA